MILAIAMLLSLPYGILSDHWGRKPVMYMGLAGILLGELWVRLVCMFKYVSPWQDMILIVNRPLVEFSAASLGLVVVGMETHRGQRPSVVKYMPGDGCRRLHRRREVALPVSPSVFWI